jgi:predicted nucleic acid-binding protein
MIIYFDSCCYGRPYDNVEHLAQQSVQAEIAAIFAIVDICKRAGYKIAGSFAVTDEIGRDPKADKREKVLAYYNETVNLHIPLSVDIRRRTQGLIAQGLKEYDAYHLAYAEAVGVDFLLTIDHRFERVCARSKLSVVNVVNPSTFLPEVIKWVQSQSM